MGKVGLSADGTMVGPFFEKIVKGQFAGYKTFAVQVLSSAGKPLQMGIIGVAYCWRNDKGTEIDPVGKPELSLFCPKVLRKVTFDGIMAETPEEIKRLLELGKPVRTKQTSAEPRAVETPKP